MTIEQRTRQRFPLNLGIEFTVRKGRPSMFRGKGEVVNISSNGVAFRTAAALTLNQSVEASMEWPVALNGDCVLRATMEGRVVRVENGLAVMSVVSHGFRTAGRLGTAARSGIDVLKAPVGSLLAAAPDRRSGGFRTSAALRVAAVSNSGQPC